MNYSEIAKKRKIKSFKITFKNKRSIKETKALFPRKLIEPIFHSSTMRVTIVCKNFPEGNWVISTTLGNVTLEKPIGETITFLFKILDKAPTFEASFTIGKKNASVSRKAFSETIKLVSGKEVFALTKEELIKVLSGKRVTIEPYSCSRKTMLVGSGLKYISRANFIFNKHKDLAALWNDVRKELSLDLPELNGREEEIFVNFTEGKPFFDIVDTKNHSIRGNAVNTLFNPSQRMDIYKAIVKFSVTYKVDAFATFKGIDVPSLRDSVNKDVTMLSMKGPVVFRQERYNDIVGVLLDATEVVSAIFDTEAAKQNNLYKDSLAKEKSTYLKDDHSRDDYYEEVSKLESLLEHVQGYCVENFRQALRGAGYGDLITVSEENRHYDKSCKMMGGSINTCWLELKLMGPSVFFTVYYREHDLDGMNGCLEIIGSHKLLNSRVSDLMSPGMERTFSDIAKTLRGKRHRLDS